MVTEDQYISYFEKLAVAHKQILHDPEGITSFVEVEDPEELSAFDEALRSATGDTVMLIVAGEGELNDNDSENHVQTVDAQIYILQRKLDGRKTSDIRTATIGIIRDIVGRTKKDARYNSLIPGKIITFRINNIPVRKVGPISLEWYGHTALITFSCPFGYTVDSGTWTDK
jgi:phosphopantetheine adenylyltransferase